ncbi:MAG: hypothetical protein AAF401_11300 [Pseudomonadota bacterium]
MGIVSGANTSATYADLTEGNAPQVGDVFFGPDAKVYKFVKYDEGAGSVAAVSGNVAYYYTLDGYKNGQVTSDLSDSVEIGAGVLQSAPADGEYCWVQIKGAATLTPALTAGSDGDPLTPTGATDGTLDVVAADTSHICAIAGDISDKEIICDFPM